MMEVGELISFYRRQCGMTIDELAEKSGVAKGTLNKIMGGVTKAPTLDNMKAIARALGKRLADFDDDPELADMFSPSEQAHIKKYRSLDQYGQEAVDGVLAAEYKRYLEKIKEEQERRNMETAEDLTVPGVVEMLVYVNPAAAGTPLYAESDFERLEFPEDEVPRGADFGVRISGRSMEPTVPDGSIAWIRKTPGLTNGSVGVFMLNDSATCKRFFKDADGSIRLESDNPEFGPVQVAEFDTFSFVGEVVGTV